MPSTIAALNQFVATLPFEVPEMPSNSFFLEGQEFESLTDEQLLLLARSGSDGALSFLETRYFRHRFAYASTVLSDSSISMEEVYTNEAFFTSLITAIRCYSWKAKFLTFFLSVYRNELYRVFRKLHLHDNLGSLVSLDLEFEEGGTLSDILPDEHQTYDPVERAKYDLLLERVKRFDLRTARMVELMAEGMSLREAAKEVHLSIYVARSRLMKLRSRLIAESKKGKRKPSSKKTKGKSPR